MKKKAIVKIVIGSVVWLLVLILAVQQWIHLVNNAIEVWEKRQAEAQLLEAKQQEQEAKLEYDRLIVQCAELQNAQHEIANKARELQADAEEKLGLEKENELAQPESDSLTLTWPTAISN